MTKAIVKHPNANFIRSGRCNLNVLDAEIFASCPSDSGFASDGLALRLRGVHFCQSANPKGRHIVAACGFLNITYRFECHALGFRDDIPDEESDSVPVQFGLVILIRMKSWSRFACAIEGNGQGCRAGFMCCAR